MDPVLYLRALRRRWWLVALATTLALTGAFLTLPEDNGSPTAPLSTTFTATHTLLRSATTAQETDLGLVALFAKTGDVPRQVAKALGQKEDQGPLLASQISVSVGAEVPTLRVTSISTNGIEAARLANAFGDQIKESLRVDAAQARQREASGLRTQLDRLQEQILDLGQRIPSAGPAKGILQAQSDATTSQYQSTFERLQALQSQPAATSPLSTLEEAVPIPIASVGSPVPQSRNGRLGLALAVGLLLGAGLALVVDHLDTRLRGRDEVEEATDLPVLAEVPRLNRAARRATAVLTVSEPDGTVAEAYRALRSSLLLVRPRLLGGEDGPRELVDAPVPKVVLVTSPAMSDGKTSTVVNLAAALAESGRRVLVLDADFRRPAAHTYLGVPPSVGLSELLTEQLPRGLADAVQSTAVNGVGLVTSGASSQHPAALLARIGVVIREAAKHADVVLVDAPPLLLTNDATDVIPHVDAVVLVAHAGRTTRAEAQRCTELLTRLAVPVLGVVLQASRDVAAQTTAGYYGERRDGTAGSAAEAALLRAAALPAPTPERASVPGPVPATTAAEPSDEPRRTVHAAAHPAAQVPHPGSAPLAPRAPRTAAAQAATHTRTGRVDLHPVTGATAAAPATPPSTLHAPPQETP